MVFYISKRISVAIVCPGVVLKINLFDFTWSLVTWVSFVLCVVSAGSLSLLVTQV